MDYERKPLRQKRSSPYSNIMKYTSVVMVLVYFCFGLYVLLADEKQLALPHQYKIILGGMLIFYGFIRFVRAYQQYFKKNRHDD